MKKASLVIALCLIATVARADDDDSMLPLASQGSWEAFEHRPAITEPPDICAAMSFDGLIFRSSTDGLELRMKNSNWSLPANVTGKITLQVGTFKRGYDVAANTDTMVAAVLPQEDAAPLMDAMATASTMTVQTGKTPPHPIDLGGSKVVLTAFRTCAGIGGGGGGENPFQ